MKRLNRIARPIVCALAIWTGSVSADAVTEWNEITMAAVTASRPGPAGMLDVAEPGCLAPDGVVQWYASGAAVHVTHAHALAR